LWHVNASDCGTMSRPIEGSSGNPQKLDLEWQVLTPQGQKPQAGPEVARYAAIDQPPPSGFPPPEDRDLRTFRWSEVCGRVLPDLRHVSTNILCAIRLPTALSTVGALEAGEALGKVAWLALGSVVTAFQALV
jgi:hypothetical protein